MTETLISNIYFNTSLKELGFHTTYGKICSDNMVALQLSSHKINHQRTKHIDFRYHFIREKIQSKKIKLDYVNAKDNTADYLGKLVDTSTSNRLPELIFKNPINIFRIARTDSKNRVEVLAYGECRDLRNTRIVEDCEQEEIRHEYSKYLDYEVMSSK